MSSGPFVMAPGDSQEVIYGIINAAVGSSLDSYLWLKEIDKKTQNFVDNHFRFTEPPPIPETDVKTTEDNIIITWNTAAESYIKDDEITSIGENSQYVFEGYNIYQLKSDDVDAEAIKIATYDIENDITEIYDKVFDIGYGTYIEVITQNGTDSGIKNEITISTDTFNNNQPLLINREYYFAVTAYAYNPNGIPKSVESEKIIISTRPQNVLSEPYNLSQIQVWPNPYFGYNPEEENVNNRQIHFTNLPPEGKCVIRIFDISGTLVKRIDHANSTQLEIWDLKNNRDKYVASGMYIVHIETDEGQKILKLAIIQPS